MTPEQLSRDDTDLDLLGLVRSPRPGEPPRGPDGADSEPDQRLMKDVIKAQLFPGEAMPVTIGRFRVLRPLGAGGMSVVYAAYDEFLDRRVAVKLLRSGGSADSQSRLLREAQAMAKLSHPNVVAVHEVGLFGAQVYVAMEFVKGMDLRAWLAEPRPWQEVLEVFTAAGHGLAAAHQAGLVHRDFKPANVLLGDDGRVRVVDFGLVRQSDDSGLGPNPAASVVAPIAAAELHTTLTVTGAILGTPAYMSPEQHLGRPADARSDQFSLCVALHEGLYGAPPFAGATLPELTDAVLRGRVRPVPEDSRVPAWLRRVVLRGLAVDPAARWPSMDDLLEQLGRDPDRLRRGRLRAAAIVGLFAGVVLALAWLARSQADVARVAQIAEANADRQRRKAEEQQESAEAERDVVNQKLRDQLFATEVALAERERALQAADAERQRAEDESAAARVQRARADEQRRTAEAARRDAEHQTARAVQEARRARDATRLAQALGAAEPDPTTVLALLRETEDPASTPGWVPAAVATLLQPVSLAVLRLHRGSVHAAAFSPDGRSVATAGDDHVAALWRWGGRAAPGAPGPARAVVTREHAAPVKFLALGPADLWASGASDGEIVVGGASPRRLQHGGELRAMALAPGGRRLASASSDGRVRVWDLAGAGEPRALAGHESAVLSAMFDRSGRLLVTAGADATARVWDLEAGGPPRVLAHPGAVRIAVFSPDGARVATGAQDGEVRVWQLGSAGAPVVHRGHTGEVVALAFRPDGGALLSASLDGTARVWTRKPGHADRVLQGHVGRVYAAQWSPDGDRIVTASQDGTARVWPAQGGAPRVLRGHAEELGAAAFSPDGDHVVTAGRDGSVRVWQVRGTGEEVTVLRAGGRVVELAWTGDGERLVSAGADGSVLLWRPTASAGPRRLAEPGPAALWLGAGAGEVREIRADGVLLRWPIDGGPATRTTLAPATPAASAAALSDDGTRAALAGADALWLLSPGTGERRALRGHTGTIFAARFSPDGRTLLTGASDRSARAWALDDLSPGTAPRVLTPHSGGVTAVAIRADGALATAGWDKRARVWPAEAAAGDPVVLAGHTGPVWALAFSPDGARIATGADDRSVRVWPSDGRDEPVVLAGHAGPVRATRFRPDGAVLASAGDDGTIRLWNADFSAAGLQARLRRASPVCLSARQRIRLLGEDLRSAEQTARACESAARE